MKHVGLNVAADAFMNSAVTGTNGGLVLAVADDPGMHSSQNEQDTRVFADYAKVPCLEPATPQEAYDMVRDAFAVSEKYHVPVVLRLTTRVSHGRAALRTAERMAPPPVPRKADPANWILLPANARRRWKRLLAVQDELAVWSDAHRFNTLALGRTSRGQAVITTGIAREYFLENVETMDWQPSHLHIGAYPFPVRKIRELADYAWSVLVLEEGYPFVERHLRGLLPHRIEIRGKLGGDLPMDGELTPETVRSAMLLPARRGRPSERHVPPRPPQLCKGCPHRDAYAALNKALEEYEDPVVTSDIGCYTLGVLPPVSAGETCVCMGASVGMARGAAEAGLHPAVAVIGDSTFLHSGVTPLMDCVASGANVTVLILDNQIVAMTGLQPTALPSGRLKDVVLGVGVDPAHVRVLEAHPKHIDEMARAIREEVEFPGPSVVIAHRECLEAARKRKASGAKETP
jgi:indolepyruvate ferredoxin oxidoreductase alpha subunit